MANGHHDCNDERTTNDERRTTNDERRTTNDQRRTTNDQRPTTNDERPTFVAVVVAVGCRAADFVVDDVDGCASVAYWLLTESVF